MRQRNRLGHAALVLLLLLLLCVGAGHTGVSYAAQASRFTLSNATYPVTLKVGEGFSIKGTLSDTNTITRVEVGVVSKSTGSYVSGMHFSSGTVNAKTYNLQNADSAIKFGQLPAGSYYYRIIGHDKDGTVQVLNKEFTVALAASSGYWRNVNGEWYYYRADGTKVTNGWAKDSHGWCWMDANGRITKSKWIQDKEEWYYLKADGYMAAREWATDSAWKYWMGANGKITKSKWISDQGEYYYLDENGHIAVNQWVQDSKGWCWLGSDGRIEKDKWIKTDGDWYYANANGYRAVNEFGKDSKGWCWLGSDGQIVKDKWIKTDGEWYYLKPSGYRAQSEWARDNTGWCWMDANGKITKDQWLYDKEQWYYLKANGYMAANEFAQDSVGWCWLAGSGRMVKDQWVQYDGEWYYIKASGYRAQNAWARDGSGWLWMDQDGRITKSQWIKSGSQWYYLKANGYMAANEWAKDSIGWCWMGGNGKVTKSAWVGSADQWYYMNASGYIGSGPVTFDTYLTEAGFPATYKASLRTLHAAHPKWIFYADNTGLSWSTVLAKEKTVGYNLVEPYSADSYINPDYKDKTYDGRWKQASDKAIAYYLDPRNFLTESGIFQFFDQRTAYNPGTKAQITTLVSSNTCFMNTPLYIKSIYSAGQTSGVNGAVLTAMVIMEQGWTGGSKLISGTHSVYPGIYNHFNIGAYTANGMDSITRGLWYASGGNGSYTYGRPWNTIEKSLAGGVTFYKEEYINNKQYTYYTKKFDIMGGSVNINHQYSTSLEGAYSEGNILKRAYTGDNSTLVFRIPVYSGMPSSACPKP